MSLDRFCLLPSLVSPGRCGLFAGYQRCPRRESNTSEPYGANCGVVETHSASVQSRVEFRSRARFCCQSMRRSRGGFGPEATTQRTSVPQGGTPCGPFHQQHGQLPSHCSRPDRPERGASGAPRDPVGRSARRRPRGAGHHRRSPIRCAAALAGASIAPAPGGRRGLICRRTNQARPATPPQMTGHQLRLLPM